MNMQANSDFKYLYKNREEAYKELEELLPTQMDFNKKEWKIITLGINNLLYVYKIADRLDLDCEPFFVEEIVAPNNKECVIATVSELKEIVMHQNLMKSFEIGEDYVFDMAQRLFNKNISIKLHAFKNGDFIQDISGKNIMIFSDGCEIGLNTLCAIKSLLNQNAKKIFLFMPIISEDLYKSFDMIVDKIFVNHKIKDFIELSYYFEDFKDLDVEYVRYEVEKRRKNIK